MVRRPNYSAAQENDPASTEYSQGSNPVQDNASSNTRGLADEYYGTQAPTTHSWSDYDTSRPAVHDAASFNPPGQGQFEGWGNAISSPPPMSYTSPLQDSNQSPQTIRADGWAQNSAQSFTNDPSGPPYDNNHASYTAVNQPWDAPQPPHHPPPYASTTQDPSEADRGLSGALAGGMAGGYAGHKIHHGFLGALGGAYAGHKLQEAYKDHHHNSRPSSSSATSVNAAATTAAAAMSSPAPAPAPSTTDATSRSFVHSSTDVHLANDGHTLRASARRVNGSSNDRASIDLNRVLSNDDGRFAWVREGGNFAASARHACVKVERHNGVKVVVLEAELRDREGRWRRDRVLVGDVVENSDGELRWIE